MRELPVPVTIRDFQPDDLSTLYEIDAICFVPELAFSRMELIFYLKHPFSVARIAECGQKVVGFTLGRLEQGNAGHVLTLDVLPEARRANIGTSLMNALHEGFREQGGTIAVLEVSAEDQGARRFYEKLDYQYVEIVQGYYYGRLDAYRMARPL